MTLKVFNRNGFHFISPSLLLLRCDTSCARGLHLNELKSNEATCGIVHRQHRLGRAIAGGVAWRGGKQSFPPDWKIMVLTQYDLPLDRARYREKLIRIGLDCPYNICDWTNDPTEWPDILCYLIESLQGEFEQYAEDVKKLKTRPTDLELRDLYGLYKQAIVGDINIDKPGMIYMTGKAKWEAWNLKKGMSNEDAMNAYISLAKEVIEKYGM